MAYSPQRIRDPIHNIISFGANEFEDVIWQIIQTRPFQRLRRIKQLGFSENVYPGATHTRFAHSVGVFHTARQLMEVVERFQVEYRQSKAEKALAAALVHDVGHGPFSHAFEEFGRRNDLKLANHEAVSDALIKDSEIAEVLKTVGSGFHDDVAQVIAAEGPQTVYDAVVSSQFDADRLDYMRRDQLMAGSSHVVIDYDWLIANLKIGKVATGIDDKQTGEIDTFVIDQKAIFAAEGYVTGLFQLYPTIYFHKATRGIEKLYTEILCTLFELCQNNSVPKSGLPDNHPMVRFMKEPDQLARVLELDDTVITGALSMMAGAENQSIALFSTMMRDRKLLKCVDLRLEIQRRSKLSEARPDDIKKIDEIVADINQEIDNNGFDDKIRLYRDSYKRSPYKDVQQSKGPLNQIMVLEPDGGLVDLKMRSSVVYAIRSYKIDRYYLHRDDDHSKNFLEKLIEGKCDGS